MEQVNRKKSKVKFALIFIIFFIKQSIAQSFNPPVKEFCGYIHNIYSNGISIKFIYENKKAIMDFKYDSTTSSFYFMDTSIVIVYYGTVRPSELDTLYHFVDWHHFYHTIPRPTKEKIYSHKRNAYDKHKYGYSVTKRKIRFTAYNYEYYKPVEKKYGDASFGSFGDYTAPQTIKSNNEKYIINYFYPKPLRYCK